MIFNLVNLIVSGFSKVFLGFFEFFSFYKWNFKLRLVLLWTLLWGYLVVAKDVVKYLQMFQRWGVSERVEMDEKLWNFQYWHNFLKKVFVCWSVSFSKDIGLHTGNLLNIALFCWCFLYFAIRLLVPNCKTHQMQQIFGQKT